MHQHSEYSPTISADGKTMIFQADLEEEGKYKIYIKQKILGKWSQPMPIESINSDFADGGCFITYDQNSLIFTSNRQGGQGKADLWISQRSGEAWGPPSNMGRPINSTGYEGFASLSPDGKTLFFVKDCPGKSRCKEKFGLYYSEKVDGKWSVPKKMPYPINTEYCEFGPIILADNLSLIFSSTRPGGFGGYDLYKTEKAEGGGWSKPVNLGSFVNTRKEDSLIAIPAAGNIMYYAKSTNPDSKEVQTLRIHRIPIPEKLQHTKVVIVSGAIRDKRNRDKPLHAEIAISDIQGEKKPIIIWSNKKDGKYIVILRKGKITDFAVTCPGYMFHSKKIDLTNLKEYREINEDIYLEPIMVGSNIVLHNLFFKFRSYKLLKESQHELNRIIKIMRDNPRMKVEISGHTDNVGTRNANLKLSRKRAQSVVKYLIKRGIPEHRLSAKGYGESKPVESNESELGRKKNRRVEIEILKVK
jgi:outer membrane protein OmpA-like peptidoglycan-associated protein